MILFFSKKRAGECREAGRRAAGYAFNVIGDFSLVARRPGTPLSTILVFIICGTQTFAQPAPLKSRNVQLSIDSGFVSNTQRTTQSDEVPAPAVIFSTTVGVDDASWLRLYFDEVVLSGSVRDGAPSCASPP